MVQRNADQRRIAKYLRREVRQEHILRLEIIAQVEVLLLFFFVKVLHQQSVGNQRSQCRIHNRLCESDGRPITLLRRCLSGIAVDTLHTRVEERDQALHVSGKPVVSFSREIRSNVLSSEERLDPALRSASVMLAVLILSKSARLFDSAVQLLHRRYLPRCATQSLHHSTSAAPSVSLEDLTAYLFRTLLRLRIKLRPAAAAQGLVLLGDLSSEERVLQR